MYSNVFRMFNMILDPVELNDNPIKNMTFLYARSVIYWEI